MAEQKRPPEELKRSELIAALEQSRVELSDDLLDLGDSLSVRRRVKNNFQRNATIWLGASAAVGFLLARPLIRLGYRKNSSGENDTVVRSTRVGSALAGITAFGAKNASKLLVPLLRSVVTSYLGKAFAKKSDADADKITNSDKQE